MPTKPRTKYRTKALIHYLDELTTEEAVEMVSPLDMPGGDSNNKQPFTIEERPHVCCVLFARMVADQIPPEWESEMVGLLASQINNGWWQSWEADICAVNAALFGTGLVSVNRFDARVRLHKSLYLMTAAPADNAAA